MIKKAIFLLFFSVSLAFSCALCALMTPTAHVFLEFKGDENRLKNIEISWYFSKKFSDLTLESYDFDGDGKLDKDELDEVSFAMLSYVATKDFLTKFEYYDMQGGESKFIKPDIKDAKFSFEDGRLVFKFSQSLDLKIKAGRVIKVVSDDENGFFNFRFLNYEPINFSDELFVSFNSNLGASFAYFESGKAPKVSQKSIKDLISESGIDEAKEPNFIERKALKSLENLKGIFSGHGYSLGLIISAIFISFLYGFFHAAGPGHAKLLTTSYFLANGGNLLKGLKFSLKIGFFHVIGAFLLVVISMGITSLVGVWADEEIIALTTKFSAIIIVLVSLFILKNKLFKILFRERKRLKFSSASGARVFDHSLNHSKSCGCLACENVLRGVKNSQILETKNSGSDKALNSKNRSENSQSLNFQNSNSQSLKFSSKNSSKPHFSEWLIAISAAIIPCPGTILVFLLAFSVGSYFLSLVSAIFMGLGMSCVIFLAAIIGSSVNKFSRFKEVRVFIEIFGAFIMLIIGIFMFFIADSLVVL